MLYSKVKKTEVSLQDTAPTVVAMVGWIAWLQVQSTSESGATGQVLERAKERRASIEWGEPMLRKEVMLKRPALGVEVVRALTRAMRRSVSGRRVERRMLMVFVRNCECLGDWDRTATVIVGGWNVKLDLEVIVCVT